MKHRRLLGLFLLPTLTMSFLAGCNSDKSSSRPAPIPADDDEDKPLEIGDIVKEWTDDDKYDQVPLDLVDNEDGNKGSAKITYDIGNDDNISLEFTAKVDEDGQGVVSTSAPKNPYFTEEDAKNGDIIYVYYYVPADSNVKSLKLQVMPYSNNNPIESKVVNIDKYNEDCWDELSIESFKSEETLGSIRVVYTAVDNTKPVTFYIDNITIVLGEETAESTYVANGESLYKTYEKFFKVGTCIPANAMHNTTFRKVVKDNFNSVTCENEGKPEHILDQKACQELAKTDQTAVAIKTSPFEKTYDWCQANNIAVRHHTLVWFDQTPQWFFREGYTNDGALLSQSRMLQRMENFIKVTLDTINERWPGLIYAIDVANEAIVDGKVRTKDNNNMNPNYWYETVGEEFVYYAFKFSRKHAAEGQKLFYNDYQYDYNTNNCKFAVDTLLKKAIEENLIDGVGIQGHIQDNQTPVNLMTDAKMICAKGLECQITELDITSNQNNAELQRKVYHDLVEEVLKANKTGETNVTAIVLWGVTDNLSWRRGQYPLLFNDDYTKKPAYYGFLEAIKDVYPNIDEEVEEVEED